MSISAEDLKPFISNADSNAVLASIVSDIRSYVSRRRNKEFFEKEIYKWDLVRKWYGRDICSAEDLKEWVSGKLYDPSSAKGTCENNLISKGGYGTWQEEIIKGQRGTDAELAEAMKAMRVDNFAEIQALPINNWKLNNGKNRKIKLRLVSSYLMCHQPFDVMQYKPTEFKAAKEKWFLDIEENGFEKYLEFGKNILLPLLAEEMGVDIAEPFDFSALDIEAERDNIRNGKYLCMIDVQDFIWGTFSKSEKDEKTASVEAQNNIQNDMENTMVEKLKNLLEKNKQIILTGAPGTGKTYIAKEIAYALTGDDKKNHPHVEFCQFHPSYDYTDFVEGLRPVDTGNENIGFERKDGIFKEFCKKALENYLNSQKTTAQITTEHTVQEKINAFLSDAMENEAKFKTVRGTEFSVVAFDDKKIFIRAEDSIKRPDIIVPYYEMVQLLTAQKEFSKPGEISAFFDHMQQRDSYTFILCQEIAALKSTAPAKTYEKVSEQKYVFIIDEINRGDISKIFGELFYAVDPGYRGEDGKIKTQYSNLIIKGDPYYDGFYIPENVYIIGTMNDIDRSVESMDFAIRRRFTWVEIEAEKAVGMWDKEIPDYKDKAAQAMRSLNKAIEETDSLSKAFHVGPAYFLKLKDYNGDLQQLWDMHIRILLSEYLRGSSNMQDELARLEAAFFHTGSATVTESAE